MIHIIRPCLGGKLDKFTKLAKSQNTRKVDIDKNRSTQRSTNTEKHFKMHSLLNVDGNVNTNTTER